MKTVRKIIAALLVALMATGLMAGMVMADEGFKQDIRLYSDVMAKSYAGKTIILHSNDVHGSLEGYAYMKSLADAFETNGAEVIMVDAGDYVQGNVYVSDNKGSAATELMVAAGYDIAVFGNHEFDYGTAVLEERITELENAGTSVINANVTYKEGGKLVANEGSKEITVGGVNIDFIGIDTPELLTSCAPKMVENIEVLGGENLIKVINEWAKDSTADVKIVIGHLGTDIASGDERSTEIWKKLSGVDFMIDGHSHSVFTCGEDETQKIQQTGTGFANIGVIEIDNNTKKITDNYLIPLVDKDKKPYWTADATVDGKYQVIKTNVDQKLSEKIGVSLVDLNGDKGDGITLQYGNRNSETNNGDFAADALRWYVYEKGLLSADVDATNLIGIVNGGGIRSWIYKGDVTLKTIYNDFPFYNTLCVAYVKGETLLRVLEAGTYYVPALTGGYPQVSGIEYNVDIETPGDVDGTYPNSTYYRPKTVKRVTIKSINGKDFDPNATYAIATNDFAATGGDTFYELSEKGIFTNTGVLMQDVMITYVKEKLNGVIGLEYENPQGRITYGKYIPKTADETPSVMIALLIMVMAASAGAGIVCVRRMKNN